MKLVTFSYLDGHPVADRRLGALVGERHVLDLAQAARRRNEAASSRNETASSHNEAPAPFSSMLELIRSGEAGLAQAERLLRDPVQEALIETSRIRLHAPLPVPESIRDFANYELHVKQAIASAMQLRARATPDPQAALEGFRKAGLFEIPPVWYELPLYYKGNRFSCIGHDEVVRWPSFAQKMDYELELAVVIGRETRAATVDRAMDAVFGYTIFNDFSSRDRQSRETSFRMGPATGKDFDTGNAFGPCIVTRDEIDDPMALAMAVRVNGRTLLETTGKGPQHSIADCISHVSQSETLHPGEIFAMGTVGNGCGYESLTFLEPGDVVELRIEGIGTLRNRLLR